MQESILILDFGSQYTQLIARRVRELNVYSEIIPWHAFSGVPEGCKGVVLSGSPHSVRDENAPKPDLSGIVGRVPLLGVCYGAQYWPPKTAVRSKPATPANTAGPTSPRSTAATRCSPA